MGASQATNAREAHARGGNAWCPADPMHMFLMMKDLRNAIGGG